MESVISFARTGRPVLGICNGFQILTEAGLLPGALQKNSGLKFLCKPVKLNVQTTNSALTSQTTKGDSLTIPINHFEGNYTCNEETLKNFMLKTESYLLMSNPNGSIGDIAGICNAQRNVGLMPHPERACHPLLEAQRTVTTP